jgi:hypothetical protein
VRFFHTRNEEVGERIRAAPPLILMNVMSTKTNANDPVNGSNAQWARGGEHA